MHGSERDQGSLVVDVIEEFRAPFVDRLLLGMIGRSFLPIGEGSQLWSQLPGTLTSSLLTAFDSLQI